jgi:hypothetical protein
MRRNQETLAAIDQRRSEFNLLAASDIVQQITYPSRFDTREVAIVKRLLQHVLPAPLRAHIIHSLFSKFVTSDEPAFSSELYMSLDQMRCMVWHGQYIGSHGDLHDWMDKIDPASQRVAIERSLQMFSEIGAPTEDWVMSYPYGASNEKLVSLLREHRCAFGLATRVAVVRLTPANCFNIPRLDTNDLPKWESAEPVEWTRKVLEAAAISL